MPAYTELTQPSAPPADVKTTDVETPPTSDKTSQLMKLHELNKAGVLTDAEFTAAKADLYGMQPPQPQNMTNNNNNNEQPQPQAMTRSATDTSNVLEAQVIDGVLTIDTPLPCVAYIYMAPLPFFCMGCWCFGASKIEFDDKLKQVTLKTWNGGCCGVGGNGHKSFVGGYEEIASFDTWATSMTINKQFQFEIKMNVQGVKPYNLSGLDPHSVALEKVRNLTSFLNSRRTIPLQNPELERAAEQRRWQEHRRKIRRGSE